jgi:hypothetical protein
VGGVGSVRKTQMQVAERKPPKGTSVPLWKHEFYALCKTKGKTKASNDLDIYQALDRQVQKCPSVGKDYL